MKKILLICFLVLGTQAIAQYGYDIKEFYDVISADLINDKNGTQKLKDVDVFRINYKKDAAALITAIFDDGDSLIVFVYSTDRIDHKNINFTSPMNVMIGRIFNYTTISGEDVYNKEVEVYFLESRDLEYHNRIEIITMYGGNTNRFVFFVKPK
jgi:hypothetical protein